MAPLSLLISFTPPSRGQQLRPTRIREASMNRNEIGTIDPQVIFETKGNAMFQTVNDFVNHMFLTFPRLKIKGEEKIYHKDEINELINRLLELAPRHK